MIVLRVFVIEKLAECETALEGDLLGWVVHDGKKIVFKRFTDVEGTRLYVSLIPRRVTVIA